MLLSSVDGRRIVLLIIAVGSSIGHVVATACPNWWWVQWMTALISRYSLILTPSDLAMVEHVLPLQLTAHHICVGQCDDAVSMTHISHTFRCELDSSRSTASMELSPWLQLKMQCSILHR